MTIANRNNYEIIVTETKSRYFKKLAFDSTVRFDSNVSDLNSYIMEHSPIRVEELCIEMKNIPSFVSNHFCRHKIGCEHFVLTSRDDRIKKEISDGSSNTYKGFTAKAFNEIFEYIDGELFWKTKTSACVKVGKKAGSMNNYGRCIIQLEGERLSRNVVVYMMHHGFKPPVVDHIDRNPSNDSIDNLRASTTQLNSVNTEGYGETGFKGVSFVKNSTKNPYQVSVTLNGEKMCIGHYSDPIEAAIAYDKHAISYFGSHAYLNFPDLTEDIPNRLFPVNHTMFLNIESLLNMSHRRLCNKSHKETIYIMKLIKNEVKKQNYDLGQCLCPTCVYRNGLCPELKNTCGYKDSIMEKYSYYKNLFEV